MSERNRFVYRSNGLTIVNYEWSVEELIEGKSAIRELGLGSRERKEIMVGSAGTFI